MGSASLYFCTQCRGKFPFSQIRYGNDGKVLCSLCSGKAAKEKKQEIIIESEAQESVKLICTHCRYKFAWKNGSRIALSCPYCGRTNLIRDDLTAEKLVEEASSREERRRIIT